MSYEHERWLREQEKIKKESEYKWITYNSVKDLSHDWLPQEILVPEVKRMFERAETVCKKITNLDSLTLKDSLKRSWEVEFDRGDEKGNVTEDGDIFMITAHRDREEAIMLSLLQPNSAAAIDYHLMFWPDSEDYGNPRNNAIALQLVKEKFDELFIPLEKSLGISN